MLSKPCLWHRAFSLVLVLSSSLVAAQGCSPELAAKDVAAIEAVHQAYRQAWLRNDKNGVLKLFAENAVIMPHHGDEPRVGMKAIEAFWFPPGGALLKITEFELKTDEIGGSGCLAYRRGHFSLAWTTAVNGTTKTTSNAGTYLDILRKQPDGSWKITHHMWDDPVPQVQ
ncbi:MAG: nuclear transport factor 2 family protein [Acidobacteriales bacterium]|nr:nuclear transport factor 2 family protein [Terriglobales bacterium]